MKLTKQEIKEAVLETLRKVEPVEKLPVFIQKLKEETFFRVVCGMITKETADVILETIKEFWGA
ncbi:MAG: hypothetical protein K2K60_01245 [Clostridia bacterium]|nr:hypothetical protein [Clostridia bacterium]